MLERTADHKRTEYREVPTSVLSGMSRVDRPMQTLTSPPLLMSVAVDVGGGGRNRDEVSLIVISK